jgi:PAS domain S-box-containing protein
MKPASKMALKVALIYAIVAGAWILFSDELVKIFVSDPAKRIELSIATGWGFVLITAGLLYVALRRWMGRWEAEAGQRQQAEDQGRKVQVAAMRDITERQQVEEALLKSKQLYQHLFEHMNEGFAFCQMLFENGRPVDFVYLAVNPAFGRLTGLKEVVGKRATEAVPGIRESDPELFEIYGRVVATGKAEKFERFVVSLNLWFDISVYGTEQDYFVAVFDVITQRKQAQETNTRLAAAVEQVAESIVITDADGTIVYVNPAFEQTTGYTRAEALGQNPRLLKSGTQDAGFYREMWDALKRGEVWHGHFVNKRKDGTIFEEDATISPLRDDSGKVINFVAVKRDVTAELQLQAEYRQSQKMEAIGKLAGGVAHDFNNLLAVLKLQASLLKVSGELSPEQSHFADEISTTVDRGAALTRQLLLFSRREALQPNDQDFNAALTNLAQMLKRILGENITLELKLATQPMFIHADASMMDQVVMNLVVNARDAMLNGGRLVLETTGVEFDEYAAGQPAQAQPGKFVCLRVSDTGCGIRPEVLPRIFEPFYTTKGPGQGTGLGLATVYGIVQRHNGWVNVDSEVGQGTTFRIYLPRLAGVTEKEIAEKMLAAYPTGNETILLVEDEEPLRVMLRKSLARQGYRILEAPNGVKALELWQAHHAEIRLLITDMMMPDGMSGKALAERLLREQPGLKLIYMSGYSSELDGMGAQLREGDNYLPKPFAMHKLAQTVRHKLDQPEAPPAET